MIEATQADSEDLDNQMERAAGKAKRQLDKILMNYVWYDPGVWHSSIYDHIGIDEVISAYKRAYVELGFKLEKQVELKPKGDDERSIHLIFVITDPGQSSFWGVSELYIFSSKFLGYETCVVTRDQSIQTFSNEHDTRELSNKDLKAKEQAEVNLAEYLRPRRDLTKLRQR